MSHITYYVCQGDPSLTAPSDQTYQISNMYLRLKNQITKSILVVDLTHGPGWTSLSEFSFYAIKNTPMHDKLLLLFPWECPNVNQVRESVSIARIYGYKDIAYFDASKDLPLNFISSFSNLGEFNFTHLVNPMIICGAHSSWKFTQPHERTHKFVYLSRNARRNRVILANEFFKRNLTKESIISCGWNMATWDANEFNKFINPEFRHLFPVTLPEETEDLRESIIWQITDRIPTAAFNIIAETSYEPISEQAQECWQRKIHTEKTSKAYYMYQFPIWTSVMGFVQFQREHGFDVFDDIIDHSYDNEFDPFKRIQMVASEIERIYYTYTLEQMQQLVASNWERLKFNRNTLSDNGKQYTKSFNEDLTDWLLR